MSDEKPIDIFALPPAAPDVYVVTCMVDSKNNGHLAVCYVLRVFYCSRAASAYSMSATDRFKALEDMDRYMRQAGFGSGDIAAQLLAEALRMGLPPCATDIVSMKDMTRRMHVQAVNFDGRELGVRQFHSIHKQYSPPSFNEKMDARNVRRFPIYGDTP